MMFCHFRIALSTFPIEYSDCTLICLNFKSENIFEERGSINSIGLRVSQKDPLNHKRTILT